MTLGDTTTKSDVIRSFHSHPMAKQALREGLEDEFFLSALAEYELDVKEIGYDDSTYEFQNTLDRAVIYTLGLMMYSEYLTRELSRLEKLQGFYGKDIHLTGNDASKNVTYKDLVLEQERVQMLLHKQKNHSYN